MDNIRNILWQAEFQRKKNWLKACRLLKTNIEIYPEEKQLYFTLGELYFSKKLFTKAIGTYTDLMSIDPKNPEIPLRIGNCFLSLNEFQLALDYYDKVRLKFPELLYNKAYALSKLGKFNESLKIMKNLLKQNVTSNLPYIFTAELYFALKDYRKAIKHLENAEKSFGKNGTIFYLKGIAYSHLDNWLKAYLEFQKAEKMKIKTYHFYRGFGITCENIGKMDEAVDYLIKSIQISPKNDSSYLDLIRIYLNQNKIMEAYSLVMHARKKVSFSISLTLLYNQIIQKLDNISKKT